MFISHHTLKWTKTCRSFGDLPHAHTTHFQLNTHTPIFNTEHISSRMRPLSFFDAFMYSSLNLRVTCRFVAMLILPSM